MRQHQLLNSCRTNFCIRLNLLNFSYLSVIMFVVASPSNSPNSLVRRPTRQKAQPNSTTPPQPQEDQSKQLVNNGKLTLKVCCGDNESNCEEFQRPEDMFGIGCCGGQPINEFEEICCEGVTRRRRQPSSYVEGCCGNQTLSYDQTCCQGVVHNVPNGECCGSQAYPRNNMNVLCCNSVLNVNVEPGLTCCGTTPYDGGIREICCGDAVFLKELFDGCCPIHGSDPPEYRQFNTRTHQCCDAPIERYSNTKCCYLADSANPRERWRPQSYDSSKFCCVFPFTAIVPKNSEGTCARVTAPPRPPPTTPTPTPATGLNGSSDRTPPRPGPNNNNNGDNRGSTNNARTTEPNNENDDNDEDEGFEDEEPGPEESERGQSAQNSQ